MRVAANGLLPDGDDGEVHDDLVAGSGGGAVRGSFLETWRRSEEEAL